MIPTKDLTYLKQFFKAGGGTCLKKKFDAFQDTLECGEFDACVGFKRR